MEMNKLFDLVAKEEASDLIISAGAPPGVFVSSRSNHGWYWPLRR